MKNITGLLIDASGEATEVAVEGGSRGHLDSMYRHLDCRAVDCIELEAGIDLWVDDEFIYSQSALNVDLSIVAVLLGWPGRHIIKGNGLFLSSNRRTGASTSLSSTQMARVRDAVAQARLVIEAEGLRP